VNHGGDTGNGDVRRIIFSTNRIPSAVVNADVTSGAAPLVVHFSGAKSSDPEGTIQAYSWDLDGDGVLGDSTIAAPTFTYSKPGVYNVTLRVSDSSGLTANTTVRILVNSTVPVAEITSPAATMTWQVGDVISFSGQGTDREDGPLPPAALKWSVIMMHCPGDDCHSHALQEFTGPGGSITAPDHEYPSYLQIRLTVTDSSGLTNSTSVAVYPKSVDLTFDTAPSGLDVAVGAVHHVSPFSLAVISGSRQSVSVPLVQSLGGVSYVFGAWSDQGTMAHEVTATAESSRLTATFTALPNHREDTIIAAIADTSRSSDNNGCGCSLMSRRSARWPLILLTSLVLLANARRRRTSS